jgi:hypothetical protein
MKGIVVDVESQRGTMKDEDSQRKALTAKFAKKGRQGRKEERKVCSLLRELCGSSL